MTSGGQPPPILGAPRSAGALRVLGEIAHHQDELSAAISQAVREQVPSFAAAFEGDRFRTDIDASLEMLHQLADGGRAGADVRRHLAEVGTKHARNGLPLEDALRAWQVAVRVVIGYSRTVAENLGVSAADAVEVVDALMMTLDSTQRLVAGAHREAELELQRSSAEHRAAFVRSLLTGPKHSSVRAQASAYGLDPSREYVAVRIACTDEAQRDRIGERATRGAEQRGTIGAYAAIDGHLGVILAAVPPSFDGAVCGVGPPRSVERLHESFAMATRALHTAQALGVGGTHTFETLALEAAVVADASVGALLVRRYLERLGDTAIAGEIIDTLEAYLAAGLNVEQTAERLTVHQNTVRYRLAKFEELAGVRLRDPRTQFELWWALRARAISTHHPA